MDERQGSRDRLGERLREALEPRPETTARIARAALSGARPLQSGLPRLTAAAVMSALLTMAALLVWPLRPPAPPAPGEAAFKIENAGDVLIVRSAEGGGWLLQSGETEQGSSSGILIVTYGGER